MGSSFTHSELSLQSLFTFSVWSSGQVHPSYLGKEVEAAQSADNTVNLRQSLPLPNGLKTQTQDETRKHSLTLHFFSWQRFFIRDKTDSTQIINSKTGIDLSQHSSAQKMLNVKNVMTKSTAASL